MRTDTYTVQLLDYNFRSLTPRLCGVQTLPFGEDRFYKTGLLTDSDVG